VGVKYKFGRELKRLRKLRGYTQTQLGERVGLSRKYLSEIENGKANISIDTLMLLLETLNSDLEQLLLHEEDAEKKLRLIRAILDLGSREIAHLLSLFPDLRRASQETNPAPQLARASD